jgi:hypothetical protein
MRAAKASHAIYSSKNFERARHRNTRRQNIAKDKISFFCISSHLLYYHIAVLIFCTDSPLLYQYIVLAVKYAATPTPTTILAGPAAPASIMFGGIVSCNWF